MENHDRRGRTIILLVTFLKFGCFTFGGGWSIIAQIQKEFVEKRGWITNEELLDYTSVGRSVPGLMIGNVSFLFGYRTAGLPGALAALLGITFPPFVIMLAVTAIYSVFRDHPLAARAMAGVRAAVVPIIVNALTKLLSAGLKEAHSYVIAAGALLLCLLTPLSNVVIVLLGAAAGIIAREVGRRAVP